MGINNKRQETLVAAYDALKREIEKEPLSPERVSALAEAIKTLLGINPLSRS